MRAVVDLILLAVGREDVLLELIGLDEHCAHTEKGDTEKFINVSRNCSQPFQVLYRLGFTKSHRTVDCGKLEQGLVACIKGTKATSKSHLP